MPPRSAVAHGARREDELVLLQVLARLALRAARPSRPNLGPQRGRVSLARAHVPRLWAAAISGARGGGAWQREEAGNVQVDGSVIAAAPAPRVLPRHLQTLYPIALGPSCCCCISLLHTSAPRAAVVCDAAGCWVVAVDRLFG